MNNAGMIDELGAEEAGPDWHCQHCDAAFNKESAFNYHVAYECPNHEGTEEDKRRYRMTQP